MRLDMRTRELIAIGASIAANCQPCLEFHASEARKYGADIHEMDQAVEVGKLVRRGAAAKMDKFASTLLHHPNESAGEPKAADADCGCGGDRS